jgi:hypothetical protein
MNIIEIRVEGANHYSAEMVVDSSGLTLGSNLMYVNTQSVSQRIRSELPIVYSAEVSRILPSTVLIRISESKKVAKISFYGNEYVVDSAGRVLGGGSGTFSATDSSGEIIDLIDIRGVDIEDISVGSIIKPVFGSEMKLQYMQDLLAALENEGMMDDVSYIDVSNIVNVHFGYLDLYRVILGGSTNLRPSNLRHNLGRLPDAITEYQFRAPNTKADINMSDESGTPRFIPT